MRKSTFSSTTFVLLLIVVLIIISTTKAWVVNSFSLQQSHSLNLTSKQKIEGNRCLTRIYASGKCEIRPRHLLFNSLHNNDAEITSVAQQVDDTCSGIPHGSESKANVVAVRRFSLYAVNRRHTLSSLFSALAVPTVFSSVGVSDAATSSRQRAVGGAESECRERGDCLEKFELDGAIGWQWGAKDRCDASDPLCGADGRLLDAPLKGGALPSRMTGLDITHLASIDLIIGKGEGSQHGTLNIGLYGDAYPEDVKRFISFLDERVGIITSAEPSFGMVSTPVSLVKGGQMTLVYPRQKIEFGIPSQTNAYAKQVGRSTAKDVFEPQPIPSKTPDKSTNGTSRRHDCAGLLSIPAGGVGTGGGFGVSDDEAFANAFQITAMAAPSMDQERRKVIGQLLDQPSMALLDRLASLPPNKGIKGVIPGQAYGPPLLKVNVQNTQAVEASTNGNEVVGA